jgi:hypothetical protein
MFTRGWLREVAYGRSDLTLADLPDLLNPGKHGFQAQYQTRSFLMQYAQLRAFFPQPVTPQTVVQGYGEAIQFGEVILPEKLGELYDDRDPNVWPDLPGGHTPYVMLRSTSLEDLRDRSPTSRAILLKDFMFDDIRDVVRASHKGDV